MSSSNMDGMLLDMRAKERECFEGFKYFAKASTHLTAIDLMIGTERKTKNGLT